MRDLNRKAASYNLGANILTFVFITFGFVPSVVGLSQLNIELTYRGINFCVISFALLLAYRSGYFLSDRELKKNWIYWLKANKKKVAIDNWITVFSTFFMSLILYLNGFFK